MTTLTLPAAAVPLPPAAWPVATAWPSHPSAGLAPSSAPAATLTRPGLTRRWVSELAESIRTVA